jgi:CheY-like chemotaxis protein
MTAPAEGVLLVDDIRDHAVNYEAALTRHGFQVRVVTTGEDALRVAGEALPDSAVIDLRLPDMSGWDLCREIRKPKATNGEAPPSAEEALVGFKTCPVCESHTGRREELIYGNARRRTTIR